MIRTIAVGTLLAASLAASNAFAQGSYEHHAFCLHNRGHVECAYDSFDQCETARAGNAGACQPNTPAQNH